MHRHGRGRSRRRIFPSRDPTTRGSVGDVLVVAGRGAPVSHASLQTRQSGDKNAFLKVGEATPSSNLWHVAHHAVVDAAAAAARGHAAHRRAAAATAAGAVGGRALGLAAVVALPFSPIYKYILFLFISSKSTREELGLVVGAAGPPVVGPRGRHRHRRPIRRGGSGRRRQGWPRRRRSG